MVFHAEPQIKLPRASRLFWTLVYHCALREVACVARSCLAAFTEAAEPSWPRRKLGLSKADLVVLLLSANEASVDGSLKRPLKWSPFEVQKIVPLAWACLYLWGDSFFFPRTLAWCVHQVKARDDCRQDKSLFKVVLFRKVSFQFIF